MPSRAAGPASGSSRSRSRVGTSSKTTKAAAPKAKKLAPEDDIFDGSHTGPIIMDDDEEDELGLKSPVKLEGPPKSRLGQSSKPVLASSSSSNTKRTDGTSDDHNADISDSQGVPLKAKSRGKQPAKAKSKASTSTTKKVRRTKVAALADTSETEAMSDGPHRSTENVSMPEERIQTFLDGYDLEATNRLARVRNHLSLSLDSARSQMSILLSRLPLAARNLPLKEFLEVYEGDVKAVVKGIGRRDQERQEEQDGWEEMKKKRIREKEVEEEADKNKARGGKSARRNNTLASSSDVNRLSSPSKPSGGASIPQGKLRTAASQLGSESNRRVASANAVASSSSVRPPSSARFSPQIDLPPRSASSLDTRTPAKPAATPAQPKTGRQSRLAKIGEIVRYMSLNGSPITGIIGADGRIQHFADAAQQSEEEEEAIVEQSLRPPSQTTAATAQQLARSRANSTGPSSRPGSSHSVLPPSSPAPSNRSGFAGTSNLIRFNDSSLLSSSPSRLPSSRIGLPAGHDDSNELPDTDAYMKAMMAEETARREATKAKQVQPKGSFSRLKAMGSSSSHANPPSSPGGSSAMGSLGRSFASLRSSSPMKPPTPSRASARAGPSTASARGGSSSSANHGAAASRGQGQRLSLVNAKGEQVDLANVRPEDIPHDQKQHLFRMFGRGFGTLTGSPRKGK